MKNPFNFITITTFTASALIFIIISLVMSVPINIAAYGQEAQTNGDPNNNSSKIVILTFGDTHKSQFTNAKPILDQYGFKASFFITCNYVDHRNGTQHMNWNDILSLQEGGQDIQSKGINPVNFTSVSSKALDFETANSKQCLEDHGINSPNIFAPKYGNVWDNRTVIDAISKHYDFADNGNAPLMFLHCDGYTRQSSQTDCRTYFDNGTLTYANRYSIREWSHNSLDKDFQHDDQAIFQKFVDEVNSGIAFNDKKGEIDAIPIIAYHSVDDSKGGSSTDVSLFAAEMKYLHDNGFKLVPMSDLGYDKQTNEMFIKQQ